MATFLVCSLPASASSPAESHDAAAAPPDELSRDLLTSGGYELRADGKVWDKIAETPVTRGQLPYLLSHLAGSRRLKALLELNLLLNRSAGEKKLTAEEREGIRTIVRRNWPVFGVGTRRDFRAYFSVQELEELDKIPARFDRASALSSMKDPEPFMAAPVAAPPPEPAPMPDVGILKPWTPPSVSTPSKTAAATPAPPAPPAPAAPAPPPKASAPIAPTVEAERYDVFLAEGPYTREGKNLLQLLGRHAPDYCLPLLRRTVVVGMPQVVLDGSRTGAGLRAGLVLDQVKTDAPPAVALSPGIIFLERRQGLFGPRQAHLLAESAAAGLEAANIGGSVPTASENGPWGKTKIFADGSRRGSSSAQEQAGELLEQLLILGLRREAPEASAYAAKRWARTARLLFFSKLQDELGHDAFLDPDRRVELREWLERPEESDDRLAGSWSGSRLKLLDPGREEDSRESSLLVAEAARAERAIRQRKAQGEEHAGSH